MVEAIDLAGDVSPPMLRCRRNSAGKRPAEDCDPETELPDCSTPIAARKTLRAVKKEK